MVRNLAVLALFLGLPAAFAAESFDESVNFSPLYSMNQNDSSLQDLFNPSNHKSGLCVPTTLTNIVADQAFWRSPGFSNLQLIQNGGQTDYSAQVRFFAHDCHTSPVNGTQITDALNCMRRFYQNSGYTDGWAYLIGVEEPKDPVSVRFWGGPRALTLESLRYYLSNHVGVLMDLTWEVETAPGSIFGDPTWTTRGGHTFMVSGYDYDTAWGEDRIQLKVVNPENTYASDDASDHFDEITMTTTAGSPDVDFPRGLTYTLSGKGFPTDTVRGYVRNIMISLPDKSVSPFMPRVSTP